jgi:capsular polysaccharide biosynthesis protein
VAGKAAAERSRWEGLGESMNVLTWNGAVLRVDGSRPRVIQDPIWLSGSDGTDFRFDATVPLPFHPALGAFAVESGREPGTVRLRGSTGYLAAQPGRRDVLFEADEGQTWLDFLLISPEDLADLRHILAYRWRLRPSGRVLEKSAIRLVPGFALEFGSVRMALTTDLPLASETRRIGARGSAYVPPPTFVINPGDAEDESIELAAPAAPSPLQSLQFELRPRGPNQLTDAHSREAFLRGSNCRLTLAPAEPRYVEPPVVVRRRDRDQFVRFLSREDSGAQTSLGIGFFTERCVLRRETNRYVTLSPGCEGLVFDQDGVSAGLGMLEAAAILPKGFSRRDGRLYADRSALPNAPHLAGPLIVFYDGTLDEYTPFLTGAIPALDVITQHMPQGSRVLLPAGLTRTKRRAPWYDPAFEHREIMNLLGYGRLPLIQSNADMVWVDDLIFLDRPSPIDIPAAQMRDLRQRALLPFDGPGEPVRRIYLKRSDPAGIQDRHEVERFLGQQGFESIVLDHMSHDKQMALFREAAFVVGSYGAGLCNILFSKPGLPVLELMDDSAFRPDLWQLCGKLGHLHGFMACPTAGQDLQARLLPDLQCFIELFHVLEKYGHA